MNNIQKAFDSHDKNKTLLKIKENLYHQRNLYLIKNRKPMFGINKPKYPKKHLVDIMDRFKLEEDNEKLFEKLKKISNRETKPKMNFDYNALCNKKKLFKIKVKEDEYNQIKQQNQSIYRRIGLVKSYFDSKRNDTEFGKEHSKMINKLKKIHQGDVLPTITARQVVESFKGDNFNRVNQSSTLYNKHNSDEKKSCSQDLNEV